MKKFLKKALKITGITTLVLLIVIILIPFLFGKQIKKAVTDYINEEVNATVYFEDIGIGIFRNFPNLTVSLDKFGVVGKDDFKGDTLIDVERFGVVVDLFSIFGDKYKVKKLTLDTPRIHAQVNKAGKANWDIMKPSTDTAAVAVDTAAVDTSSASALSLQLSAYAINNAQLIYDDRASDMYLEIDNLNHSGSGDFEDDAYDFDTKTSADSVTFVMEGTSYLHKGKLDADLTVNIDNKSGLYTLKDNRIGLNAIELKFDGWVSMKGDDIGMDIKFGTNENTFKSILSMVPGMYTKDFADIDTDGTFELDGSIKGTYNEKSIPGFKVHLGVANGRFKYPDLPEEVKDINFDLKAESPGPTLDNLKIEFPKFHALFGKAPIDARLLLTGVTKANMFIDAYLKASLNLEDLLKMFPMEGQDMKGKFTVDGTAKGTVNTTAGTFPVVNAMMKLENGYYKTVDFPSAIDKMSLVADMKCPGTNIAEAILNVTQFHAEIDGEPLDATLSARNFDNVAYNAHAKGKLDLAKLNKIYPLEGTTMAGLLNLDITTSGVLSEIEAGNYANLPTSGSLDVSKLSYKDADIPQGITIDDGRITFTPQKLNIERYSGKVGRSPVVITGALDNYLAYALLPNQKIKGEMSLVSSSFDVNEWMVEEPATASPAPAPSAQAATDDVPMEVFEVPGDIDFTFNCAIAKVLYDNMTLDNMSGQVVLRDRKVSLNNLLFNTLGGNFKMNGGYETKDAKSPGIDFALNVANLDVKKSYETFVLIKSFAPIAKYVNGKFGTGFAMTGKLLGDMSPDLNSINIADGIATITDGTLKGFKALDMVADKIKVEKLRELKLNAVKIFFKVANGRIEVEPFDVPIGNGKMVVKGSNGLDQSMAYDLAFDMPPGVAGAAALNAVGGLIGKPMDTKTNFKVSVGLGGTVDAPKITYVRNANGEGVQELVQEKIQETVKVVKDSVRTVVTNVVNDAKDKAKAEAAKIIADAEAAAAKIRTEGRNAADKLKAEANKRADDIEKSAKNPIEKIAKKKAADIVRKEGVDGANKVQKEADDKADKLLADARTKSNALLSK
jgi:hypothetical protein